MQFTLTKTTIIHPILFAILPLLLIISMNMDEIIFDDILLPFLIIILPTILLWYFLNLIIKNKMKSGLIMSLGLVLFFSYGHFFNMVNTISFGDFMIGRHRYILISFFLIFVIGTFSILKTKKNHIEFTTIVNVIAAVIILISIFNISASAFENYDSKIIDDQIDDLPVITLDYTPNVYYVILDEYTSSKVLNDVYQFDNQNFLSQLETRGFHVTPNSHSNYAQTGHSVTSSMNMNYLNYLSDEIGANSANAHVTRQLWNDNKIMKIFKSYNYTIINLTLEHGFPELADYDLCPGKFFMSEFQITLWESTMLQPLFVTLFADQAHRDRILCKFSELSDLHNSIEEPFFVYAHFQLPHPPYVFGPNGESTQPESLSAGASAWNNKLGYVNQIQFTNKKVIETIDKILLESSSPPIIILQGDHGTPTLLGGGGLDWNNKNDESITERMSIFNAYYIPDQNTKLIYDSITPVNSFRIILNSQFNENYELLEDRSYFSDYENPYNFTDVTEILLSDITKD